MNISSLLQNSGVYNASKTSGSTGTQNTQNTQTLAEILKKLSEEEDSVSFSKEGMMRSKTSPEKPDFTNMSDEELVSFLTEMQERTGAIPGVEEGTDASELTSEQLQSIRDALTDMSAKMDERMSKMQSMGRPPHGMGMMQGPPPQPPIDTQNMSDDSLKTLLETIKADTGSIPGIEDSESTEVSSLTSEQLQNARDTLTEMMQKRVEEMTQSSAMFSAITAYEANSTVSL